MMTIEPLKKQIQEMQEQIEQLEKMNKLLSSEVFKNRQEISSLVSRIEDVENETAYKGGY